MRVENNLSSHSNSLRINTRAMERKTSFNQSFNDHFRSGLKEGVSLANGALKQIAMRIPGGAQLSASLSEAANKLKGSNSLNGVLPESGSDFLDSGTGNFQDNLVKSNKDMLEQQVKVSQITTSYNTRSYILKALFDSLKTIGANIR